MRKRQSQLGNLMTVIMSGYLLQIWACIPINIEIPFWVEILLEIGTVITAIMAIKAIFKNSKIAFRQNKNS